MVVAHLAQLYAAKKSGELAPNFVGRVTDASEGSVSVSGDVGSFVGQAQAWWMQTKYGASYWNASAPYRTFRPTIARRRRFNTGWHFPR